MVLSSEKEDFTHGEDGASKNDYVCEVTGDHEIDATVNEIGIEDLHDGRSSQIQPGAVRIAGPQCEDTVTQNRRNGDIGLPIALPVGGVAVFEGSVIPESNSKISWKMALFFTGFISLMTVMNVIFLNIDSTIPKRVKEILVSVSDTEKLEDKSSVQHFSWMTINNVLDESGNSNELLQNPQIVLQMYLAILIPLSTSTLHSLPSTNIILDYCAQRTCDDKGQISTMAKVSGERTSRGGGIIATEIGYMRGLTDLVFQKNSIVGTIPTEIGSLENLQMLDFSNNMLSGTIPSEIGNLKNLEWLFLGNNLLEGTIPTELGNLKHLKFLDISSNSLRGTIPLNMSKIESLIGLSLQDNNFSSGIHTFCSRNFTSDSFEHVVVYTGIVQDVTIKYDIDSGVTADCVDGFPRFDCDCCICT